jgi:OmpA-OmpF porin, OOP family
MGKLRVESPLLINAAPSSSIGPIVHSFCLEAFMQHRFLFCAAALFATAGVHAQPYIGGTLGASKIDSSACIAGATNCKTSSYGGTLFGGYQLHRLVAVEADYVNFGKATAEGAFGSGLAGSGKLRGDALGLYLVPRYQEGDYSVYVKFGFARSRVRASGEVGALGLTAGQTVTITRASWAIGGEYDINRFLGVRVEHLQAKGKWLEEGDASLTSAGVKLKF